MNTRFETNPSGGPRHARGDRMMEKLPHWFGRAMHRMRPGLDKIVAHRPAIAGTPATIDLTSPAFEDGSSIPKEFTQDGARVSPPLAWANVPREAKALVLIVEDADSPMPMPLVHAIVWGLQPTNGALPERGIGGSSDTAPPAGVNSFMKPAWLPPDPPPGHGPHRYCFQLFALDTPLDLKGHPGRRAIIQAMKGHVLAHGQLIGIYERT
jgi:hypothetical protein